jgi:hypothetical protein
MIHSCGILEVDPPESRRPRQADKGRDQALTGSGSRSISAVAAGRPATRAAREQQSALTARAMALDQTIGCARGFVQKAHALAPNEVGADTKRIRVTASGAVWV